MPFPVDIEIYSFVGIAFTFVNLPDSTNWRNGNSLVGSPIKFLRRVDLPFLPKPNSTTVSGNINLLESIKVYPLFLDPSSSIIST
mgnify:CR=1 FL=1